MTDLMAFLLITTQPLRRNDLMGVMVVDFGGRGYFGLKNFFQDGNSLTF
jgi:hypothetical protein